MSGFRVPDWSQRDSDGMTTSVWEDDRQSGVLVEVNEHDQVASVRLTWEAWSELVFEVQAQHDRRVQHLTELRTDDRSTEGTEESRGAGQ